MIQFKNLDLEVKDIDAQTRRVKIALSRFNNVDADGDVILKGAFAKSIMERGAESMSNRKIKFLRYHDFEHQIGKFLSLEETNDYLLAVGELGRSTKGNDAFLDYQDGIITEHSIGFNMIPDKTVVREDGLREIREVILWEGSAVTFGSNEMTPVFDVSKGDHIAYLDKLNKRMDGIINALKNGKGTDERLIDYEMTLRVLQKQYNSLIEKIQPAQATEEIDEPRPEEKTDRNELLLFNLCKNLK